MEVAAVFKKLAKPAANLLMAVVLALGLVPAAVVGSTPGKAYAADTYLQVGDKLRYAGYSTKWYYADGQMAYCGQPSQDSPAEGTYEKHSVTTANGTWSANVICKIIFYGYGGPGFDWGVAHGIWPSEWYDGTPMSDEHYAALTHIVLSDFYANDYYDAILGCNESFEQWGYQWVVANIGDYHNDNSIESKMLDAPMPSDFPDYCFQLNTGSTTQIMLGHSYYNPNGTIRVAKSSASPTLTDGNGCYTFEGAVYGVYADEGCTDSVGEVTLDAEGEGSLDVFCNGSAYYVKEISAPAGYLADGEVHEVVPVHEATTDVAVEDVARNGSASMGVWKTDSSLLAQQPEGAGSLEGAEFTFRYYDGYYTADDLPANPVRTWVMRTNAAGVASLSEGGSMKVSGDDFYLSSAGTPIVPLGTVSAVETKAPEGYNLDDGAGNAPKLFVSQIVADDTCPSGASVQPVNYTGADDAQYRNIPVAADSVKRGNLEGAKADSAAADGRAQGGATLAGAKIAVVNRNRNDVVSPETGKPVGYGGVVCTLTTDETGSFSTMSSQANGWSVPDGTDPSRVDANGEPLDFRGKALACGEYYVHEVVPPEGYLKNSAWSALVTVDEDGQVLTASLSDEVKRGDIEFTKADERTQARLANVPFIVTSKTTGEAHVVVADANGMVVTEAGFNAHSQATNANDAAVSLDAVTGDYVVDEGALVQNAGVWFSGHSGTGGAPVDDALGALPYDTYTIQEVRCAANAELQLVTFEAVVNRHARSINLGTVADQPAPFIGTTLLDKEGTHSVEPGGEVPLIDSVSYMNFLPGEYTFKGELHALDAEGNDVGVIASREEQVKLPGGAGTVDIVFTVDTATQAELGRYYVAFERCYDEKGNLVASHEDLSDDFQTVLNPEIGTTLTDLQDGDHELSSAGPVTVTDEVAYRGLTPGKAYSISMTLHKVADDGTDGGALTDADGEVVSATQDFTPADESGTVNVSATFTPDGGGYDIVAFEELKRGSTTYAVHADITDQAQTVHVPAIGTKAIDANTGTCAARFGEGLKLVDAVAYENLVPGASYTVTGTAHVVDEDGLDAGPLRDDDGGELKASATFVPEEPNGSVEVEFNASAVLEPGMSAVVFEELVRDDTGAVVAEHKDLSSDSQTVHAPAIGTSAAEKASGTHYAKSTEPFTVVDTVQYENLPTGMEYTLRGTLHGAREAAAGDDAGVSSRSGIEVADAGVLVDAEGKPVQSAVTFVPEEPTGSVEVSFSVDPTLAPADVVVFEELLVQNAGELVKVAEHADASDRGQTVSVGSISTSACDKATGTHEGSASNSATITDVVTYVGLEPDGLYRLEGTLYDKATAEPLVDEGAQVVSEMNFQAEGRSGEVPMDLTVKNTPLDGHDLVVFEKLYDVKGDVVAVHEDIEAASQTVRYTAPPLAAVASKVGAAFDKTGYWLAEYWWVLLVTGAAFLAVGVLRHLSGTGRRQ